MKAIYKKAMADYLKLVELVKGFTGGLDQLCEQLKGYNLDHERFDCNYGSITVTICAGANGFSVYEYVGIWDDEATALVKECIHYADVQKLAEGEG